ncbi:Poly(A) RNA polymerase cid11 [Entamoeba marina]
MSVLPSKKSGRGSNNGSRRGRHGYDPNPRKPKHSRSPEDLLNEQLAQIFDDIILPKNQLDIRRDVASRVESVLNENFDGFYFKAVIYGSTEYGLCLKNGDLDICCTCERIIDLDFYQQFAKCFDNNNFEVKLVIETARVPIIKMTDLFTNVNIDLSFNQLAALHHTEFFNMIIDTNPLFQTVVVLLKHWLKIRDLNTPFRGTLSSAALSFLVIHYFIQLNPQLYPEQVHCYMVNPVIVKFAADRISSTTLARYNVASLVVGFFRYYKDYDWENPVKPFPDNGMSYFFPQPSIMRVIDPTNIQMNCTKSVTSEGLRTFKMEVVRAWNILTDYNDFNKVLDNPVPYDG